MRAKLILPAAIVALVLVSGCAGTGGNRPEDMIKNIPQIQEFIASYPDSDLHADYRSEGYIRGMIDHVSDTCGPYFVISEYWEISLRDPHTKVNLTVWLDKKTGQISCLYRGEGDPSTVYVPRTQGSQLTITGFSGLEVSDETAEFHDGNLYLSIGNPILENLIIKRVTASYLDDVIKNTSSSGPLFQGDSYDYVFNFSRTIGEDDPFWIDLEVLYDLPDSSVTNQRTKGSIISGIETDRIIECNAASFVVERYNFYVGTRVFSVMLRNTGSSNLKLKTLFREGGEFREVGEPFTLHYADYDTIEIEGVTKLVESVLFFSEACPGASEVIFVEEIPGV